MGATALSNRTLLGEKDTRLNFVAILPWNKAGG
ncbi:hypothetical protein EDC20_12327 [Gluconobacter oxydans]|nr:hypothetical protein EDC20_12327 [Gluconobacter oxydans]